MALRHLYLSAGLWFLSAYTFFLILYLFFFLLFFLRTGFWLRYPAFSLTLKFEGQNQKPKPTITKQNRIHICIYIYIHYIHIYIYIYSFFPFSWHLFKKFVAKHWYERNIKMTTYFFGVGDGSNLAQLAYNSGWTWIHSHQPNQILQLPCAIRKIDHLNHL
jgi:hypothetical protein